MGLSDAKLHAVRIGQRRFFGSYAMLKMLVIVLSLVFASPVLAADAPSSSTQEAAKTDDKDGKGEAKKDAAPQNQEAKKPNEFFTPFYKVTLPEGWEAVKAPVEEQGMLNAIFANTAADVVVTMIIGPRGGADAKTIAELFAEQFKAPKPPVEKKGQYTFTFPRQEYNASAWVTTDGKEFMITTVTGDSKVALAFIHKNIVSEDYPNLLPK